MRFGADTGTDWLAAGWVGHATPDGAFTYEARGSRQAPALVFLHGIGGGAMAWRPQLEAFSPDFHAVAWDMPGYGGSKPLESVTFAGLAAALRRFLDALDLRNPVIVGHSIGGMVLQRFLQASLVQASLVAETRPACHPHGARAAVLSGTSPAFGRPEGEWQREFIRARLGPLDAGRTMPELAPEIVRSLVGNGADPRGLALAETAMARVPEATYRAMMLALLGFDMRAELPRIAVPCLVLAGEADTNAPAPMMAKMAARIPGAVFASLAGAGHLANLERPAAFNEALRSFLAATAAPSEHRA